MRRKVIQQNPTTLVVSLPAKWAKQKRIEKGDELDINETEEGLLICTKKKEVHKSITINATNLYPLVKRAVSNKYIEGVEEIIIISQKPELIEDIPDVVKSQLIGFEVVEQTRDKIIIKEVSHITPEEFDIMLRRTFLIVKMMGSDLIKAMEANETNLNYILKQDDNVNRFCNFCLRTINKKIRKNTAENCALYTIIYLIENLADNYKKIAETLGKNIKLSKDLQKALKEITNFYAEYIDVFYNFKISTATSFGLKFEKIKKSLNSIKVKNTDEAMAVGTFQEMLNTIILMLNNQLNYQKIE